VLGAAQSAVRKSISRATLAADAGSCLAQAVANLGREYITQWILPDSARALLLRLRPSAVEGDTIDWALTLALAARSSDRSAGLRLTLTPPGVFWRRAGRRTR